MFGCFESLSVVEAVIEPAIGGVGLLATGELTSSAHDDPEAGSKVWADAFILEVAVTVSGFEMRSPSDLFVVAGLDGVGEAMASRSRARCKA